MDRVAADAAALSCFVRDAYASCGVVTMEDPL